MLESMNNVPSKTSCYCLVSDTAYTVGNKSDREPILTVFILALGEWERQTRYK